MYFLMSRSKSPKIIINIKLQNGTSYKCEIDDLRKRQIILSFDITGGQSLYPILMMSLRDYRYSMNTCLIRCDSSGIDGHVKHDHEQFMLRSR